MFIDRSIIFYTKGLVLYFMSEILPKWLLDNIPEVNGCGLVGYDEVEDIFWVKESRKTSLSFYSSMAELMENYSMDCCNLSIDDSVKSQYRVVKDNCLVKGDEIYFVKNDAGQLKSLEQDFLHWQKLYSEFEREDDWKVAYHLIEFHPAFWKPMFSTPTFMWNRNNGHSHIDQSLVDGSVLMEFDFDNKTFFVSEFSFEEAYLKMGKLIVDHFSFDTALLIDESELKV